MNNVNKYKEILAKVDKMSIEEINGITKEIKQDVQDMNHLKETQKKEEAKKETEVKLKKYKYPFIVHMAGKNLETDHIFTEGQEYTEEEIRIKMLEHQYYDFSSKVTFDYLKEDNVLLPIFQQHKKG